MIGIVVGTYSSVFIAAPTLLFLEMRFGGGDTGQKPRNREVEARGKPKAAGGKARRKAGGKRAPARS